MVSDWHWIVFLTLCQLDVSNGHWAAQCWNSMTRRHPHEGCQKAPRGTLTVVLGDIGIYRPARRHEWLLQIMWPQAGRWSGISGFRVKSHPSTRETDAPLNSLGHVTLRGSGKADKTWPKRKPRYIRHILFAFACFGFGSSYLMLTLLYHLSPITSTSAFTSPLFLSLSFLW